MSTTVMWRLHASAASGSSYSRRRARRDQRAAAVEPAAVQDPDRDVLGDGGQNGARVQDLRAEIRQLRGFLERQPRHDVRRGDDARVGCHHAVDVGPDLNLAGVERGAEYGGRVVGPATAERRGHAGRRGSDVPAGDRHVAGGDERLEVRGHGGSGLFHRRQRTAEGVVGDQHASRIDPDGRKARHLAGRFDDTAAQELAEGGHRIAGARRRVFQSADRVQQVAELGQVSRDAHSQGRRLGRRLVRNRVVPLLEVVEPGSHCRRVGGRGRSRQVQQPVGDSRQRRHHDHGARAAVRRSDVTDEPPDRFRIRHRRSAEFQHHRTRTHYSSTSLTFDTAAFSSA